MEIPAGTVDIHVHIQPWEQLLPDVREAMISRREDTDQIQTFQRDPVAFAAWLDGQGIARVGLVNYTAKQVMGFDGRVNNFVADYRDKLPDRFIAWGGMDPDNVNEPVKEMDRLLDTLRLDGIKIHPPHQEVAPNAYLDGCKQLKVLYGACEQRGVPVMIHTGTSVFPGARSRLGDPMLSDDVAVDFPELKIILAHCGRPLWYDEAIFLARRHPNVHLDLSGIPPKRLPEVLPRIEMVGDKVLWGSDWPGPGVKDLKQNIVDFLALPQFSDEFKQKVLVDNPNRLFPPR